MTNQRLLVKLNALHAELAAIQSDQEAIAEIDDQTLKALGTLVNDVGQIIDRTIEPVAADARMAAADETRHVLTDRIKEFETRHPRVSQFLSQVTDLLAMMGI
jgi:hypothetical protein